jgi:hypothetical protein
LIGKLGPADPAAVTLAMALKSYGVESRYVDATIDAATQALERQKNEKK